MAEAAGTDEGGAGKRVLLADFARMYGADERTVKRWRRKGRDAGDEIYLEDPEKVLGWWQRNMKQRVPAGIMDAVRKWRLAGNSPGAAPMQEQAELPVVPPVDVDEVRKKEIERPVSDDEKGLEKTIERLEEMEVRLSRVAAEPGQSKPWLDTVSRLGTEMKRLRMEWIEMGKLVPRDLAEKMIHEFHAPVEREIRLMIRVMAEAQGLPVTPAMEEHWNQECDRLFARFQLEVFQ